MTRRVELVGLDLAGGGDQHVAHHAQAVDLGVERAQPVGQLLRQHGDDPAREVDAGGAVVGVDVDGAAGLHVVADVGDRHQQAPALAATDLGRLAIDGVVEVARVLAVDGDQRDVGQVHAVLAVGRAHLVGQRAGHGDAGFGEFVRHAVLAHRDLDLHAGVVDLAQHLLDPPDRLAVQAGRLGELHHHHLPRLGRAGRALGDQDILAVALVLRRDQPDAAFVQQAADDRLRRALDDLQHPAFRPPLAIVPHDAHAHPVLVQHRAHLVGRQVDVGLAVVAQDVAVAIAMALDDALDFIEQAGRVLWSDVFDIESFSFLKCPGGGIGRRTSFRY